MNVAPPREERAAVLLSPPGNPAAYPEVQEFWGADHPLRDWRFRESSLPSVHEIVRAYRDEVPAEFLPRLRPELHSALLIACTGMSYGKPPGEDRAYWQDLENRSGVPVATATRAVAELWQARGYDDMILVSPYDDRATAEAEAYWTAAGTPVRQVVRVQGGHPYRVTAADLRRAIAEAALAPGVPVLLSGTGMRTQDLLPWVAAQHDAPVWSVNQASAEWMRKEAQ